MSATGIAGLAVAPALARSRPATSMKPSPELSEAAFEALYARTSRALWAYVQRLSGDPSIADDVHQESYLRYLARPCPTSDERQQSAYLYRIASNLVKDRWRRQKTERSWLDQLLGQSTSTRSRSRQVSLKIDFEGVLQELAPKQRALLWLAYVEGYRHEEIAEILDLKAASVRVVLFRAKKRLAALLAQHGLEPRQSELFAE